MSEEHFDEAMLEAGTTSHYEDASYYDLAYRRRRADVRFYVEQAKKASGPVLELGCGSGRVTMAIADEGIDIVGMDAMPTMLDRLEERLEKKPKRLQKHIELHEGDLKDWRIDRRFPLVISPFNVFMHLYTREDIEAALETVSAHLAPNGRFVFDVLLPSVGMLARDPAKVYRSGSVKVPSRGKRYHYRERFDYDDVQQIQMVDIAFVGVDDPLDFHMTPLAHRQFFPAELEMLLHYNGFAIEERFGDFEGEALSRYAESQVIVARRR